MVDVQITAQIANLEKLRGEIKALGSTPVPITLDASASINKIASELKSQLSSVGVNVGASLGSNIASGVSKGTTRGIGNINFETMSKQFQAKSSSIASRVAKASSMDDSNIKALVAQVQQSQRKAQIDFNKFKMLPNAFTKADYDNSAKQLTADVSVLSTAMADYGRAATEAGKRAKEAFDVQKSGLKANEMASYMDNLQKKWSKLFKKSPEMAAQFESIRAEFKAIAASPEELGGNLNAVISKLKVFENTAKAAGLATQSWGDSFKQAFGRISQYFGAAQVWGMIKQGTKAMVNNVKEIDTTMTDLKKVSDGSNKTYDEYLKNASKRASDMSTSVTSYIQGTTEFARMGYNLKDAQKYGELAEVYYNVGDGVESTADAAASMIATMKAFGKESVQDATKIVDIYNKLGNSYSIQSGQVGQILQNSASALSVAGASMEEASAMGTAMFELNRNASKTGSTLKVLSLRLRGKYNCASYMSNHVALVAV